MRTQTGGRRLATPRWAAWLDRAVGVVLVTGLGVLLGLQYMAPDKRVLSVIAAAIVAGIAWRLDIVSGLGIMVLAMPFPKGTTFGSTNLALILLVLVIYLLRVGQRELPRPHPTKLDLPILGLFIAYVVSFYNVTNPQILPLALANFELFVGTLFMYYVLVQCISDEASLRRLHGFQTMALGLILLFALWELNNPGKAIVPGWIDFSHTIGDVFDTKNVRIGGIFYDYELLADFCGLNILFLVFQLARTRDVYRRVLYAVMLVGTALVLFATVTRGPIVALGIALAYMTWIMRRRLKVVPVTIIAATIAAGFFATNFVVATFTRSGDLLGRLTATEFRGLVPETRASAWESAWEHFLQHPIIGAGPFYSIDRGLDFWYWPHNLYLYVANIVGVVGLVFFLWLLWTLFRLTRPRVDSLADPDYVESYLLIARVQFVYFLVDQTKIEYLRNATYQYQIWLLFGLWVAAERIRHARGHSPVARAS